MSLTTYYPNGQQHIVEDRIDGLRIHYVTVYDTTGKKINELRYNNGQIGIIAYRQNDGYHNLYGPAYMEGFDDKPEHIQYWQNGLRHNLHGPASIEWYTNEQIKNISYRQNNRLHNLHGPAHMYWYINLIKFIDFYHFGKLIKEYWI